MNTKPLRSVRTLLCAVALPIVLPLSGVACSSEAEDRDVDVQDGRKGKGGSEAEGGSNAGGSGGSSGKGGAQASAGASAVKGGSGGSGGSGGAGTGGKAGAAGKGGSGGSGGNGGTAAAGAAGTGAGGGSAGKSGGAGSATIAANHLSVVKPTAGQIFVQSGSPAKVDIPYEVLAGSDIASVEYIIETDFSLGTSTTAPSFPLTYPYQYPGDRITEARGFDATGKQIASAYIDFVIQGPGGSGTGGSGSGGSGAGGAPSTGKCLTDLDALGIAYTPTKARGVVDAVKLTAPLNGVRFAKTDTDTLSADPMACEFVKTLYDFATVLKAHGFTKIGTLGAYCYRCCCSWSETNYCRGVDDPEPSCGSNGYSNHSFGRALDIRYLYKADGTRYDVNDPTDFVKYKDEDHTCTTALAAQTGVSKELYQLVCDASAKKVFGSILTPNHNAAHRNHFHADTGKSGTPSGYVVKDAPWSWGETRVDGPGDEGEDE